jgi:hypothetical protein
MAIYSEINSPGYFAQLGQWPLVVMFAVLLFCAAWSVMILLKKVGTEHNDFLSADTVRARCLHEFVED